MVFTSLWKAVSTDTRFYPSLKKTEESGCFATALFIPSQHDSPEDFTKNDALFCLCYEKVAHLEMLQHDTGLVFVKGSTAARQAKGFRKQNDTVGTS